MLHLKWWIRFLKIDENWWILMNLARPRPVLVLPTMVWIFRWNCRDYGELPLKMTTFCWTSGRFFCDSKVLGRDFPHAAHPAGGPATINFVSKTRNCALKTRNFVSKWFKMQAAAMDIDERLMCDFILLLNTFYSKRFSIKNDDFILTNDDVLLKTDGFVQTNWRIYSKTVSRIVPTPGKIWT